MTQNLFIIPTIDGNHATVTVQHCGRDAYVVYQEFRQDMTPIVYQTYLERVLHGPNIRYHPNGKKQAECNYEKGKLHGKYTVYDADGAVSAIYHYDHGEYDGICATYFPNGRTKYMCEYVSGIKHGREAYLDETARQSIVTYIKGVKHGDAMYWDVDGQHILCNYNRGMIQGAVTITDAGNVVLYISQYVNNMKHGYERYFYPDGKMKAEFRYYCDKPVGVAKLYDENGKVIREHRMGDDLPTKQYYFMDENGHLHKGDT